MATHQPLPESVLDDPDPRRSRRQLVDRAHQNALLAYRRSGFHMLDPRYSVPGVFHAGQVGEAAGQFTEDVSLNVPDYSPQLLQRYPNATPLEQLRIRWAIAMKPTWTYEELLEYRRVAFGYQRKPGDNPWENVPPYDVAMIARYPFLSQPEQLRVREAVAVKSEWTPEELEAYRRAAFAGLPFQRGAGAAPGVFHAYQVGETAGAYGPRDAANAFQRLAGAMEGVAGQARRAATTMRTLITKVPRELPSDPAHDATRLGGFGTPNRIQGSTQI